jgi:hypothetical protein
MLRMRFNHILYFLELVFAPIKCMYHEEYEPTKKFRGNVFEQ